MSDDRLYNYYLQLCLLMALQFISMIAFFVMGLIADYFLTNSIGLPLYLTKRNYSLYFSSQSRNNGSQVIENKQLKSLEIPWIEFNLLEIQKNKNRIAGFKINDEIEKENEKKNGSSVHQDEDIVKELNFDFFVNRENFQLDKINQVIILELNDVLVLLGENGSGKTTFINLIAKLINPKNKNLNLTSISNLNVLHQLNTNI